VWGVGGVVVLRVAIVWRRVWVLKWVVDLVGLLCLVRVYFGVVVGWVYVFLLVV
jgi:hypothetical protein